MIWGPPPVEFVFRHDGYEERSIIPRDFAELSGQERAGLVSQIRAYFPAPFSGLPDAMVLSIVGGLPGAQMASRKVKTVELLLSGTDWTVFRDWNPRDNIIHALGRGGDGATSTGGAFASGGGGGGGAAWAALVNAVLVRAAVVAINIAVSSGDTHLVDVSTLLAKSGSVGAVTTGGAGGQDSASVGDFKFSGGTGASGGFSGSAAGGGAGGGAAGPSGAGSGTVPNNGDTGDWTADSAGTKSGTGGAGGFSSPTAGVAGTDYGAGGGGGGATIAATRSGAAGRQGLILAINNVSL